MKKTCLSYAVLATMAILILAALLPVLRAQVVTEESDSSNTDILKNLKFRNLGPAAAGGRVAAVAGVPDNPSIYYVGAAAGGVFKSTDGGSSWKAVFEHESTASIGDLALAPSNPNFIWVGTGEANVRNDVIDGAGVYFSPDAGQSWKFMGLGEAGQISRVIVDPADSNVVFVGALGHAWAPNSERGVFRTTDGGKTWKKVLFVDDTTGVADLAMEPGNPKVLYAALWHFRRYPWMLEDGGDSSGLYRSTDGGDTWKKLTEGMPPGPLGRIAVAVAPSNPSHVYALIAAKRGMLWQSTDRGDHWTQVSDNHALDVRPFYFSRLAVSPVDENKVYFLSFNVMESDDGGKTAHIAARGVHSDHHAIWIDPKNPNRILEGGDGGAFLSLDGAKSWRFLDGLPIEQFYMVAADSAVPYTLCGGLQDNNAWCGPSTNLGRRSGVANADWYTVAGGDGEYAVPAPSDLNIVYVDSQNGSVRRLDKRTHLSHFVRPYLEGVEEMKPSDLKYRFNWTSPIAVSETNANEVYLGGNVLFKSTDGGRNWTPISGDLSRNDKSKQEVSGEPVEHDISGAETYGTILCITIAPTDPNVIWVGTDDGLVQVTRDGGKSWTNTTAQIPGAPEWARVYQVGVSPFDAGAAFVAFDGHELADRHAYVYKTANYGQSWQKISTGLPDTPAEVVREDPNRQGLLVLGNDTGLFYSPDAGEHWKPLKANFPTAPVWDLKFVKDGHDLVVATHGRGIFVLDDIRPVEELTAEAESGDFHLFTPAPGTLFHRWQIGPAVGYSAPDAPDGVVVDYSLKSKIEATPEQKKARETPVKIVITDSHGQPVNTVYGPSLAGVNRYVWNLHYEPARRIQSETPPEEAQGEAEEPFGGNQGPWVLPGRYHVAVTVKGQTQQADITVRPDPNLQIDPADFRAQAEAALQMRSQVDALNEMINRIDGLDHEITAFQNTVQADKDLQGKYSSLLSQARSLDEKLKALKAKVYSPTLQRTAPEDDIHELADFHSQLTGLAGSLGFAYAEPPTPVQKERMTGLSKQLEGYLAGFNDLVKKDVTAYNKAAQGAGAPTLFTGEPVAVKPAPAL
ncbi:MAG TPA: glycosyl hydrolase [Terriglobia bacterium]